MIDIKALRAEVDETRPCRCRSWRRDKQGDSCCGTPIKVLPSLVRPVRRSARPKDLAASPPARPEDEWPLFPIGELGPWAPPHLLFEVELGIHLT